ncbi:hydrogenase nickel incorporation protein HypB [Rhodospirillum rubrum]|uniref:Hydrogenase maturation factor HypB n=1 Tax=Rhodospirillum rubrum (strain ATCC 11170 / ATH 1.1.1 / DSM 467 / LMG 4362 / NCIMB 8255 / S1) TaxID=269796 RepID=Q2RV75_RHORT|nr:hydrogenase nickel incorporation protein HypB [Rhodospirillum rubrum]ABC21970.1 Hydrogenase accessory protein HypB [Rhodospirillum rubrum ATCC 11170]AEO47679.1 hydrogenase accessory protein HypB [Rhodospirillum rubrum F11]MBK5953540.1 hydrogenase accessory protein HypB [Rhodospirillum rubrum]QXG81626.1 hydrogenase nickel incorporation protein HypB [Rhodospirillum rubrum]HAQ00458.1 hydrogenase accessory protein HypB [Rhodospirillum rubrum]
MCSVCGCAPGTDHAPHDHAHDHDHSHDHDHDHSPASQGGGFAAEAGRLIRIERDVLSINDRFAALNRQRLAGRGILALNLVSSPGSGKTTLLARTVGDLKDWAPCAVIEGDQQTDLDAERIRATGVSAVQINTGKGCHLDAHRVGHALDSLDPPEGALLFIENVGNLVCPAAFDLGEAHKVVFLSVTEGEDKPLKYPDMFAVSDLMVLTKADLLPYVSFDVERCWEYARRVRPDLPILVVSAVSGQGLEDWYAWIRAERAARTPPKDD